MSRRFGVRVKIMPFTNADDFRVQLGKGLTEDVKKQIEADTMENLKASMQEPFRRLFEAVTKIHERLSSDSIFRDSLIDNTRELVDLLPAMNIIGDKNLDKLIEQVKKKLVVDDITALRSNIPYRQQVAGDAQKILDSMKAFVG
jgi:hypothetical protein